MLILQKSIKSYLLLTLVSMLHIPMIHTADTPTRTIKTSPSIELVQKYLKQQKTKNQSPLLISNNTNRARQQNRNYQPLGCCALITQGARQLQTEFNNSMPYFRRCAWPPRVDRSDIHPDIVECNENSMIYIGGTCCCPCLTGYLCYKKFEEAFNQDVD